MLWQSTTLVGTLGAAMARTRKARAANREGADSLGDVANKVIIMTPEPKLETATRIHALHPANNDCPACQPKATWRGMATEAEDVPAMHRAGAGSGQHGASKARRS